MNTLTVARWTEDIAWTAQLPGWYVHVVQKDSHLPNVGREPTSFVWSIVDLYEAIDADHHYAFVQGNPFDHAGNLIEVLTATPHPSVFLPLSHAPRYYSDATGYPHHGGLDVGRWYERIHGRSMTAHLEFWPGGQFMVPGSLILARSLDWWSSLLADLMADPAMSPWAMERLWPSLFGPDCP